VRWILFNFCADWLPSFALFCEPKDKLSLIFAQFVPDLQGCRDSRFSGCEPSILATPVLHWTIPQPKTKPMKNLFSSLALAVTLGSLLISTQPVLAQGTAFTYQGQLQSGGALANGTYDLAMALYATNTGGNPISMGIQPARRGRAF
jgi:hypothetical protein